MSSKKIELVGCDKYNYKGVLFEADKVYIVPDAKAKILLRSKDSHNRHFFRIAIDAPDEDLDEDIEDDGDFGEGIVDATGDDDEDDDDPGTALETGDEQEKPAKKTSITKRAQNKPKQPKTTKKRSAKGK